MTFGSLFAGIGGFDLGFERSGMKCIWQIEIDRTCQKVLSRHWPNVERISDVTESGKHNLARVDVLCGGFPCQDLSIAGKRQGLIGEQSGLWFEFIRIIDELKPRYAVIENVPDLLSSFSGDTPPSNLREGERWETDQESDFSIILRGLVKCGYGVAWRIFDAQFDNVAQRRERVFIVGSFGNGSAAEILFESEGVPWDPPTRRKTGQDVAFTLAASVRGSGDGHGNGWSSNYVARGLNGHSNQMQEDNETFICNTFNGHSGGADDNNAQGNHLIAMHDESLETYVATIQHASIGRKDEAGPQGKGWRDDGKAWTLDSRPTSDVVVTFDERNITSGANRSNPQTGDPCHTLHGDSPRIVRTNAKGQTNISDNAKALTNATDQNYQFLISPKICVRRLTPRECERLQGFPDDWTRFDTDGKEIADSARYRMLGNAVCVNVAEWIGKRIVTIES